jgi:hypothetical protein
VSEKERERKINRKERKISRKCEPLIKIKEKNKDNVIEL